MTDTNNRISASGVDSVASPAQGTQVDRRQGAGDFEKLLRQQYAQQQVRKAQQQPFAAPPVEAQPVSFSKHALQRLDKRQIALAPEQNQRLGNAVQAAANKGARQSLVFMDGIAFVVNVSDRTVVTALDVGSSSGTGGGEANTVFTNIDSAVVA
ncbi:MAG: TIGR02530 family flagellar biosynthesis protein [Caldilineaceae bacterium]